MSEKRSASILNVVPFTIANGSTTSGSADTLPFIDLQNYVLVGVEFPATITGTALTLQVSNSANVFDTYGNYTTAPTNYVVVSQGGSDVTITKQNSKLVLVGATYRTLEGIGRYLQFVSSGSEGGARSFKAYLVPR